MPKTLQSTVGFWEKIYQHYSSNIIVAHDPKTFEVMGTVDIGTLEENVLFSFTQEHLQNHYKKYFKEIKFKDSRYQTGQKNKVEEGIKRFLPFKNSLKNIFIKENFPPEFIALSFVESSFNYKAGSNAGAVGVWQFIRSTGSKFLKINTRIDERKNILLSTIAAIKLLKGNKRAYKSWELAIVAYNSGVKTPNAYLKKKKRSEEMEKYASDMDRFFSFAENNGAKSFQFASHNYYPSFLAMIETLKKIDLTGDFFSDVLEKKITESPEYYVCKITKKIPKNFRLPDSLKELNPQFLEKNPRLQEGDKLMLPSIEKYNWCLSFV